MIIGYNFFNMEEGCTWDTPICTDELDELNMNEGTYDEAYIDLDTNVANDTTKPQLWTLTTIIDSKFTSDLDAGSIGANGFNVKSIQLFRTVFGANQWSPIGEWEFDPSYNMYNYVDRYVQNGSTYQYALVPVANAVLGDKLVSDAVKTEFEGIFITDKNENRKLDYNVTLGDVVFNTNSAINQPINSAYPIVTFGQSKYRSGQLSFLPLSDETVALAGSSIDKLSEQVNRQKWLDFLNNGKAKVLRIDSGVCMLVVTTNAKASHNNDDILRNLATITFNYVEIGDINLDMLTKNNLLPSVYEYKTTYNDNGELIVGGRQ